MIARLLCASAFAALLVSGASAQTAVPVGHFNNVELKGGGHVTFHYGAQQRVVLTTGSTQYTKFEMDGNKLVINTCGADNCPMIYDLDVDITTPGLHGLAVSGGGHIEVAPGFPVQDDIDVAVQGGGRIDTRSMTATSADAAVDGGGQIHIRVARGLDAAVNGGGQILYTGSPAVTSAINGGGQVEHEGG
jgi:Putative auto-transporter adhesin, head GIN domain